VDAGCNGGGFRFLNWNHAVDAGITRLKVNFCSEKEGGWSSEIAERLIRGYVQKIFEAFVSQACAAGAEGFGAASKFGEKEGIPT